MSNEKNAAMEEEEIEALTLTDEEGNEIEFELMDVIEYDGNDYAVLLPLEDEDAPEGVDEVVILMVESETEDEQFFAAVEDEEVEMAVFNIFKDKYKDQIDFVDVD